MPKRVYRESGARVETVKLGIAASCASVSSALAIALIIEEAYMPAGFPGFPPEGMAFLRALVKNNRREWFQPRKPIYDEKVKAPMLDLVVRVTSAMLAFAPAYAGDPEKAIFRIYRDTRFSKDKTPYKTHIAAVFHRRGLNMHGGGGLYFAVSAKEVEVAGGIYMPAPETLRTVRTHLADHHEEFRELIQDRALRRLLGDMQG